MAQRMFALGLEVRRLEVDLGDRRVDVESARRLEVHGPFEVDVRLALELVRLHEIEPRLVVLHLLLEHVAACRRAELVERLGAVELFACDAFGSSSTRAELGAQQVEEVGMRARSLLFAYSTVCPALFTRDSRRVRCSSPDHRKDG